MKLFKITGKEASYDEWKSVVIVAESKKRALDIAQNESQQYNPMKKDSEQYDVCFEFGENQLPLKVEEIQLNREAIVVSEFIGG